MPATSPCTCSMTAHSIRVLEPHVVGCAKEWMVEGRTQEKASVHSVLVQASHIADASSLQEDKQYSTFCVGCRVQWVCRSCISVSSGSSLA